MNPKVDQYIKAAQPFAQPILKHIRKIVHESCPEATEEIKWGMPFFIYKGPLCNMAAFKAHCAFGFWHGSQMENVHKAKLVEAEAMGNFGRITSLEDLPSDQVFKRLIKDAVELKDKGINIPKNAQTKSDLETDLG